MWVPGLCHAGEDHSLKHPRPLLQDWESNEGIYITTCDTYGSGSPLRVRDDLIPSKSRREITVIVITTPDDPILTPANPPLTKTTDNERSGETAVGENEFDCL